MPTIFKLNLKRIMKTLAPRIPAWRVVLQLLVAVVVMMSLGFASADAQTRKKRTKRARPTVKRPVITNPTIAPPGETEASSTDPKIISTADQTTLDVEPTDPLQSKKTKSTKPGAADADDMQQTINSLSNQVNRLNDRLTSMQEDDRYLLDMERLTRAEQRAEQLRSQLIDGQSKIADLQSRMDQVEYMLKPENIDRATQGYGTVHPEEARESRRRQLENEKGRLQAQLSILETSRLRLESAIATADSEVDLLRARLNERRMEGATQKTEPAKPAKKPE